MLSKCCTNLMHDAHIRMVLRNQAAVICVRPIVLNPWNADALQEIEKKPEEKSTLHSSSAIILQLSRLKKKLTLPTA